MSSSGEKVRTKKTESEKRKIENRNFRPILRYGLGKKLFFIFHFSFFIFHFSFSERYQISDVTYTLEKTREQDLRRVVPINTDKIFESKEDLDSYLADLQQRLMNTRAFQNIQIENGKLKTENESSLNKEESAESRNYPRFASHHRTGYKITSHSALPEV